MPLLEYQVELTDEMLDEARGLEGMEIRTEPWNEEATLDTIRHYAWGIGDRNPLWSDEQYSRNGPYGEIVAPPTFLYSVYDGAIGLGFAGLQPIYAGTSWVFHDVVRRGERFRAEARMGPVVLRSGRTSARFAIQEVHTRYLRVQDSAVVAEAVGRTFRVPHAGAKGGLRYAPRSVHEYKDHELAAIGRHAVAEVIRGAEVRRIRDVVVGERLPAVVKGPIDQITMTAYYAGCVGSPGYKANEIAWLYRHWALHDPDRLPNNYDATYFSERVLPSLGHQNASVAHEIGMPGAYNNGPQKCGWLLHAVTNWMGDSGRVRRFDSALRRPDIFGDTVWCGGEVREIGDDERGMPIVRIALEATNQLGETTAVGSAEVELELD